MRSLRVWVAGAALAAAGCGGPSSLSGVVLLDGQPLDTATVVLTPVTPGAELVVGMTGPDGRFRVTPSAGPSIAAGTYKVTVSKRKELPPPKVPVPPPPEAGFPGAGAAGAGPLALPPETIPPQYSDPGKTVLSVTVPTSGEIKFELVSK
jgi:hypothetical protein